MHSAHTSSHFILAFYCHFLTNYHSSGSQSLHLMSSLVLLHLFFVFPFFFFAARRFRCNGACKYFFERVTIFLCIRSYLTSERTPPVHSITLYLDYIILFLFYVICERLCSCLSLLLLHFFFQSFPLPPLSRIYFDFEVGWTGESGRDRWIKCLACTLLNFFFLFFVVDSITIIIKHAVCVRSQHILQT